MSFRFTVGVMCAGVSLVLCLTGCSSTSDVMEQALRQSSSAVASGGLALEIFSRGDSTIALTNTALDDALTELGDAQSTVTELEADDAVEVRDRQRALDSIRDGIDAVSAARAELPSAGASGVDESVERLDDARAVIDAAGGAK